MPLFDILSQALFGNWSLYDKNGSVAVPFDTFFSVDVVNEGRVTQYPTEPNSFASYNKVQSPGTINVTVALTGGAMERSAVVDRLQELVASTELLSIVTPEKTYTDYALESFDYVRTVEDGLDRLKVNLRMVEVKQVSAEYSNETIPAPKNSADSKTKSAGKQATDTSTTQTQQAVAAKSQQKQPRQSFLSWVTS